MTQQILSELKPDPNALVIMYTTSASNLGVGGQVLVVNQGNSLVNSGNLAADYGRDCDFVSLALGPVSGSSIASFIAFETLMPPGHMAQWQDIYLSPGETIIVQSRKGQCSFVFTGHTYD